VMGCVVELVALVLWGLRGVAGVGNAVCCVAFSSLLDRTAIYRHAFPAGAGAQPAATP
jgi:hypothetical protein